jgi:branched-chain amino acid transport system permease protein
MSKTKISAYLKWSPLLAFIVLAFAPLFVTTYYLTLLTSVLCWIGLAVSWHFFSGTTKYISLGSAAFFGIGVYITAIFSRILPLPIVLLLAAAINFLFALCGVGLVTLRLKGIYFAIFTFGLAELLNNAILFWEMQVTGTRGRFITPINVYYPILVITFVIIFSIIFLKRT